jgi:hypothetical protein
MVALTAAPGIVLNGPMRYEFAGLALCGLRYADVKAASFELWIVPDVPSGAMPQRDASGLPPERPFDRLSWLAGWIWV